MRVDTDKDRVQKAIIENNHLIKEAGFSSTSVSAEELMEYFSGSTPYGDTTTLAEVIQNRWLLIHEVVELSNLKSMGFIISRKLIWTNIQEVLKSHVAATEVEIRMALKHKDLDWIQRRAKVIR